MKHFFVILFAATLLACNKKPLETPYTKVYGTFEWKQTLYRPDASSSLQTLEASSQDFTAKVTFSDDFMVRVYVNNEELASSKFRVLSRTQNGDDFEMRLRVNFKGQLDLGNELRVSMLNNDSLFLNTFPYNGYAELTAVSTSNMFVRQ
jgi:hypothetical protein